MKRMSTRHGRPGGVIVNVSSSAVRPGITDTGIHATGGEPDRVARLGPTLPMGRAVSMDQKFH